MGEHVAKESTDTSRPSMSTPATAAPHVEPCSIDIPLCVDLDGTLVKTDLLLESVLALLRRNILYSLACLYWLLFKGKAYLKQGIAERVILNVGFLPYQEDFLEFLKAEATAGRRLVLVTAAHQAYAQQVSKHLGLFAEVLGSDGRCNLAGEQKLGRLVEMFGEKQFDYAGNSHADLKIWPHAQRSIIVDPEPGVSRDAARIVKVDRIFDGERPGWRDYVQAIRLHQWFKNVLLFMPLAAAHQLTNLHLDLLAFLGFIAFSLCASSAYVLNDLLDLPLDRGHPLKRARPFASGKISIKIGVELIILLFSVGLGVALLLPAQFVLVLGLYYLLTLAYSLWLKKKLLVDVLVLASLYAIRIIAGAAAVSIQLSFWLLTLSMFLFLSLAMVKRYAELCAVRLRKQKSVEGRGYQVQDLATLCSLGTSSGHIAVLVLALYINSSQGALRYTRPELIWLLCPVLLYWVSRIWVIAGRGKMHEDPVVFAMQDGPSRWAAVLGAVILCLAV